MTREQFENLLKACIGRSRRGRHSSLVNLDGKYLEDAYSLKKKDNGWAVNYCERGQIELRELFVRKTWAYFYIINYLVKIGALESTLVEKFLKDNKLEDLW